jgi:transposase
VINQLRSWLATYGAVLPTRRPGGWWLQVRDWAGAVLPAPVQARLERAHERLQIIEAQLTTLTQTQRAAVKAAAADSPLRRLIQVKGVAVTGASVLLDEGLVWRDFRNRRQVGGMLGFTPVPYQSGEQARDQGIDRAGNSRWRALSVQLAWRWVQWQPSSALTQWFQRRFGAAGPRARRIGIVALARKLVVALWRYVTTGIVPTGATLKTA